MQLLAAQQGCQGSKKVLIICSAAPIVNCGPAVDREAYQKPLKVHVNKIQVLPAAEDRWKRKVIINVGSCFCQPAASQDLGDDENSLSLLSMLLQAACTPSRIHSTAV